MKHASTQRTEDCMMIYFVIFLAAASRFVPHVPNFAPITALAIFSGAYLSGRQAVGVTLAVRLVSDALLGFFSWPLMVAVYASHAAGVLLGRWVRLPSSAPLRFAKIGTSSLAGSALFFVVTNFAFLYSNYPHSLQGIGQSYANGLPFLKGTVFGDMTYTLALFGLYALVHFIVTHYERQKQFAA